MVLFKRTWILRVDPSLVRVQVTVDGLSLREVQQVTPSEVMRLLGLEAAGTVHGKVVSSGWGSPAQRGLDLSSDWALRALQTTPSSAAAQLGATEHVAGDTQGEFLIPQRYLSCLEL